MPVALLGAALPRQAQSFVECTRTWYVLDGEAPGDLYGWVSMPIPDVNGDSYEELFVSALLHDTGGPDAGRVYLHDGRTGAELFHVDGRRANENFGHSLRAAGDVNGDGIEDLIAGSRIAGQQGVARILSGADGSLIHAIRLGAPRDLFGYSVTGVGDVNQDGIPDVAVGAIQEDTAALDAGRVYVVSGADGASVLAEFGGDAARHHFGSSLALLGDVTGDGRPELAVGATNAGAGQAGRAYVYDLASGTRLYALAPDASGSEFGQYFLAAAGEVDGDGFPDLYVGDFADGGGRGKAYLFSGVSGALIRSFTGNPGAGFGIGRPFGDLDGDGRSEIVLASWTDSSGAPGAGKAEVFSGASGALLRTVTSQTAGENFGYDAHALGDLDGDGQPELVVTAASHAGQRGRVYVLRRAPIEDVGAGLAGSGGRVPRLLTSGCPQPGGTVDFRLENALGGALGVLVLAGQRVDLPFRGGILYPALSELRLRRVLGGAAGLEGAGALTLSITAPPDPALLGRTFFAQGVVLDAGAPNGAALTNGVSLLVH